VENRSSIAPIWAGQSALLVASGPSLTEFDIAYWRGAVDRIIVINDALRLVPDADLLWFTDRGWFDVNRQFVLAFAGQCATLENDGLEKIVPSIWSLRNMGSQGFCAETNGVMHGYNGGYAALHLAAHLGITDAVLLGYDCKVGSKGFHWFGDHVAPLHNPSRSRLSNWSEMFATLEPELSARGIRVRNASPDTALTCFQRISRCAQSA
jgi:hypothetical protein